MFGDKHLKELRPPLLRGLTRDTTIDGGFTRFVNVKVVDGGLSFERRNPTNLISDTTGIPAGFGLKNLHELRKIDGTRYLFADIPEEIGLSITAPSVKPGGTAGTAGSIAAASYGSVVYQPTEDLFDGQVVHARGNTFCNQTKWVDMGHTHTDWADASVNFKVEIDGKNAAYDRWGNLVDTYKWSHDGGSNWIATAQPIQTTEYFYTMISSSERVEDIPVAIGKSSGWFDYSDVVFYFDKTTNHTVGDNWTFSLNPYSDNWLYETSIIAAAGGLNDMTASGNYTGLINRNIVVVIDGTGTPDTFRYSFDEGDTWEATKVSCAATVALGTSGATIAWAATTGHTKRTQWSFPCYAGTYKLYYTYATYTGSTCTGETNPSPVSDAITLVSGSNHDSITATWTDSGDTYDKVNFYRTLANDDSGVAYLTSGTPDKGDASVVLAESDATISVNNVMQTSIQDTVLMHIASATNTSTEADGVTVSAFTQITGRLSLSSSIVPSWANMNDYAYRVDGTNMGRVFHDNTTFYDLGVVAPIAAPVCANATGGDILPGNYQVCYTYVKHNSTTGEYIESNPSPKTDITVSDNSIDIDVIAATQVGVDYIRIYRHALGAPTVFYRCQQVANTTATITLIKDDNAIVTTVPGYVLVEDNDIPPIAKYIEVAGAKMWYGYLPDEDGGEFLVRYSKTNKPEQVDAENELEFDPDDGDVITGMKAWRGTLLIFKRKAFYMIDDVFSSNPSRIPRDKKIGCIDNRTIAATGNNTIIWVSEEGPVEYNGDKPINIGQTSDGKDKVNSIIKTYINKGAEFFGEYYNENREYRLLMYTRNSAETSLVLNKELIYQLDNQTWSEYQYKDSSGNREYPTAMGVITDDKDKEILMLSTITNLTGTTGHLVEGDYDGGLAENMEILDSDGDGTTACDKPRYTVVDSDDTVYTACYTIGSDAGALFSITEDGIKTCIATPAEIETIGGAGDVNWYVEQLVIDTTNEYLYFLIGYVSENWIYQVIRSTYGGTLTSVVEVKDLDGIGLTARNRAWGLEIDSDGSLYLSCDSPTGKIFKITDPGEASQVETSIKTLDTNHIAYNLNMLSDNLYFVEEDDNSEDYVFSKISDVTGTPTYSTLFTPEHNYDGGSSNAANTQEVAAISSTEIYYIPFSLNYWDIGNTGGTLYKASYSDGTWTQTACTSVFANFTIDDGTVADIFTKVTAVVKDGDDNLIIGYYDSTVGVTSSRVYRVLIDDEHIELVASNIGVSGHGFQYPTGFSFTSKDAVITCGYNTDNVFRFRGSGYWLYQDIDVDSWSADSEFHIVSCYSDLGSLATKKRASRAYLEVEGKNVNCGEFYIQTDMDKVRQVHISGETADPDGGTESGYFWLNYGEGEYDTDERFDDDDGTPDPVEHKERCEVPVFAVGNRFRYMIRGGTHINSYDGKLKVSIPTLLVSAQKGKTNE